MTIRSSSKIGDAFTASSIVFAVGAIALFCVSIGFLASLGGLLKNVLMLPFSLFALALSVTILLVAAGGLWCVRSVKYIRDSWFIAGLTLICLVSRLTVVAVFPHYVLIGDDEALHHFVVALANGGFGPGNLGRLSVLYDYQVWLSRAFPIYYPLQVLFGASDLIAVRIVNSFLDAGTVFVSFLIGRRLVGSPYSRVAVWLLTIFPFHLFDVLNYTPQIPGTFFFISGIWLLLDILSGQVSSQWTNVFKGTALGILMLLAGIQRGAVDVLLLTVFVVMSLLLISHRGRWLSLSGSVVVIAFAFLAWWPAKHTFESWVNARDSHQVRSHVLGFMSRGWNPVSLGEYLYRYEQLDEAAAPPEKARVLLSTLVTEAVRDPLVTFGAIPLAKLGKLFSLGYAAPSEEGLADGGYRTSALLSKALTATYAPVALLLCIVGLIASLNKPFLAWRLSLPLTTVVIAAGGIVLLWETSPRYSHCLHFALMIASAVGFGALRRGIGPALRLNGRARGPFLTLVAAGVFLWCGCGFVTYEVLKLASPFTYTDMRSASAELDQQPVNLLPVHPSTIAWEQAVTIGKGTHLPASLRVTWQPVKRLSSTSMSLWLSDTPADSWLSCRIVIPSEGHKEKVYTFRDLMTMKRGLWPNASTERNSQAIEIILLPPEGRTRFTPTASIELPIGYALIER